MRIISDSDESTQRIGQLLALHLRPGTVVALYGDLGAGKTMLSRGIARGLGVTEPVTSPTFTVVQEYRLPSEKLFYHLDMYRISDEHAALAFGIDEYLFAPEAITVVEWPEQIKGLLTPEGVLNIKLSHVDENKRMIDIPDELGRMINENLPR